MITIVLSKQRENSIQVTFENVITEYNDLDRMYSPSSVSHSANMVLFSEAKQEKEGTIS